MSTIKGLTEQDIINLENRIANNISNRLKTTQEFSSIQEFAQIAARTPRLGSYWLNNNLFIDGALKSKLLAAPCMPNSIGHAFMADTSTIDLINFSTATWTNDISAGNTIENHTQYAKEFTHTRRIACPPAGSGHALSRVTPGTPFNLTVYPRIEVIFYLEEWDASAPTIGSLTLYTDLPANNYSINLMPQKPGWNIISFPRTAFTTAGVPNWNTIRTIEFRVNNHATRNRVAHVAAIRAYGTNTRQSLLSIIFDDCFLDAHLAAVIAAQRDIRLSFSVRPSSIGASGFCTARQIEQIQNMGHEIIYHGQHPVHAHMEAHINAVGYDAFLQYLLAEKAICIANGWRFDVMTYPENRPDSFESSLGSGQLYRALNAAGVRFSRSRPSRVPATAEQAHYSPIYVKSGRYILNGLELNSTSLISDALTYLDNLTSSGAWGCVQGHAFTPSSGSHSWNLSDFVFFMDQVVFSRINLGLQIRAFGEACDALLSNNSLTIGLEN